MSAVSWEGELVCSVPQTTVTTGDDYNKVTDVQKNGSAIPLGTCAGYQKAKGPIRTLSWGPHSGNLNLEGPGPTARSED